MRIQLYCLTAATLAFGCSTAVFAAENTDTVVTTVTKTTNHHYVYYGDHQIYFAPETKTYYWQTTSTSPWQSGTALPVDSQGFVKSGGVELDLDTERPYERNEWVIGHYKHLRDGDDNRDRH
jgi:hypothetical protein